MKQYRFTTADFFPKSEDDLIEDAVMDAADLRRLKKLAGIVSEDYYTAGGHDPALDTPTAQATDSHVPSPIGSPESSPFANKRQIERELQIKPGTEEWFKLWYARPDITGEKPVGDLPAKRNPNPKYLKPTDGKKS
jgi:hypothetical protein